MLRVDGGVGVQLGPVLARAGEGTIYEVVGRSDWVAKVFHRGAAANISNASAIVNTVVPQQITAEQNWHSGPAGRWRDQPGRPS